MRCPAEAFGRSEAFGIGTRYRRCHPRLIRSKEELKEGPRGRGSAQGSASVSKASDSFATSTWGVAFTWTRIWSKNSRSLWNERNFSADPHKSPLSSTRRRIF